MLRFCQCLVVCGMLVMPSAVSAQSKAKAGPAVKSTPRTIVPTPKPAATTKPLPAARPIVKVPTAPKLASPAPRPTTKQPLTVKPITPIVKAPASAPRITMPNKPWVDIKPIATTPVRPTTQARAAAPSSARIVFDDTAKKTRTTGKYGYDPKAIKTPATARYPVQYGPPSAPVPPPYSNSNPEPGINPSWGIDNILPFMRFGGGANALRSAPPASTIVGSRSVQMGIRAPVNSATVIGGRSYTGHALDRMMGRGVTPSVVENAIRVGQRSAGNTPGTSVFTDLVNRVQVVVDSASGRVITVK